MSKTLDLTLPVMLHSDKEIPTFLEAKHRLEQLGQKYRVPVRVGAFLPYMPGHSRKQENFERQITNQEKYRLPIWLVETGIEGTNSLVYVPENKSIYDPNKPADHERILEQVAKLRDLDPNPRQNLVVGPHIAAQVAKLEDIKPGTIAVYTPEQFRSQQKDLYEMAKLRFAKLENDARRLGLTFAVEIAPPATHADYGFWTAKDSGSRNSTSTRYHAFNDLERILDISQNKIVVDTTHLAGALNLQEAFNRNSEDPQILFDVTGSSSWGEFNQRMGNFSDYLHYAVALHMSGVEGIGVRLTKGTEAARKWGGGGELPNLLSTEDYIGLINLATNKSIPIAIEEDFITPEKPLDRLDFREADAFLEPILNKMSGYS